MDPGSGPEAPTRSGPGPPGGGSRHRDCGWTLHVGSQQGQQANAMEKKKLACQRDSSVSRSRLAPLKLAPKLHCASSDSPGPGQVTFLLNFSEVEVSGMDSGEAAPGFLSKDGPA